VDNQRAAIIVLVVSICLFSLFLLYLKSRPARSRIAPSTKTTEITVKSGKAGTGEVVPPSRPSGNGNGQHNGSAGFMGAGGQAPTSPLPTAPAGKKPSDGLPPLETTTAQSDLPPVRLTPDTAAQLEEKASRIREHRRKVLEASETWMREKLDDENLTGKTREVYRLRLLPDMKEGIRLLEANDYQGALRAFDKALEDPDASAVSKHLIYDYMLQAAARMKDKMLFANLLKSQGGLQRDNDLGVLGLEKSSQAADFAEYMTDHLKAANDRATFDRIVERDMKNIHASASDRERIEADVKARIDEFEAYFDDRKS